MENRSIIKWHSIEKEGFPKKRGEYLTIHEDRYVDIFYYSDDCRTDYHYDSDGHWENIEHEHYKGFILEDDEGAVFEQTVLFWAELPDGKEIINGKHN